MSLCVCVRVRVCACLCVYVFVCVCVCWRERSIRERRSDKFLSSFCCNFLLLSPPVLPQHLSPFPISTSVSLPPFLITYGTKMSLSLSLLLISSPLSSLSPPSSPPFLSSLSRHLLLSAPCPCCLSIHFLLRKLFPNGLYLSLFSLPPFPSLSLSLCLSPSLTLSVPLSLCLSLALPRHLWLLWLWDSD